MGAFLDKPKVEKENEDGRGNEVDYAVSSMQGWRVDMEDSHTAKLSLDGLPNWSFFAVFDGHAGSKVAEYSSQHLLEVILEQKNIKQLISDGGENEEEELIKKAVTEAFLKLDVTMREISDAKNGFDRSGSTSVCVLISPSRYYFINCGDSRAMLCRQGEVHFATADHKPNNPIERERIQNAGGSVMIQRVNGSLAVSRALGDYEYKNVENKGPTEQLVSPEPDITVIERNSKEDEFLVLACDGIYDVSTNEELCSYIMSRLRITENLTDICNDVVDMSLNKGSRDNMTLVLLGFPAIPKPTEKAREQEKKLDDSLRDMMKDICTRAKDSRGNNVDFSFVLETFINEHEKIEGLPPGGGIYSKRGFLESVYKEFFPEGSSAINGDACDIDELGPDSETSTPMESESGV
ncbi:protein phosphatase 1A-like [Clavelina lepadiformis]|uniref:PPM-type phosphatase domain-containing protein n=1 Tax=Clavelina lepadiformis TaxID=159417 RepID=A0ABP0EY70_CLALP